MKQKIIHHPAKESTTKPNYGLRGNISNNKKRIHQIKEKLEQDDYQH